MAGADDWVVPSEPVDDWAVPASDLRTPGNMGFLTAALGPVAGPVAGLLAPGQALESTRRVAEGIVEMPATMLRGAGARQEWEAQNPLQAQPRGPMGDLFGPGSMSASMGSDVMDLERPVDVRPVTENPLYEAGEAVSGAAKSVLPPANPTAIPKVAGDVLGGVGSVAGNIGLAILSPMGAMMGAPLQGSGEAAERAVKAGASPRQQADAANLGLAPGATDLIDVALIRAGGIGATKLRRVLSRLVEGGLIEGTQEGLQQFLQNAIARGVYKPEQDLSEDVLYSAFIGAIVGGSTKLALGGREPAPQPIPQQDIDAIVASMGVPQPPPIAPASEPPATGPLGPEPPPATLPTGVPENPAVVPSITTETGRDGTLIYHTFVGGQNVGYVRVKDGIVLSGQVQPEFEDVIRPLLQQKLQQDHGDVKVAEQPELPFDEGAPLPTGQAPAPPIPGAVDAAMGVAQRLVQEAGRPEVFPPSTTPPKVPGEMSPKAVQAVTRAQEKAARPSVVVRETRRGPLAAEVAPHHMWAYDAGYKGEPRRGNDAEVAAWDRGKLDRTNADRRAQGLSVAEQEIEVRPGVNTSRLIKLVGVNLYGEPSTIAPVSLKEMLQNALYAIKSSMERKAQKDGKIDIIVSEKKRTITVSDNGVGMTPEILGGAFLEIAGTTQQDTKGAPGGFGVAKLLFLYGNDTIKVVTMRDGKVSVLQTTGEALHDAAAGQGPKVKITVLDKLTPEVAKLFPNGHGTVVSVTVPKSYRDTSTGQTKEIPIRDYVDWYESLANSPLFYDIDVTFNGKPLPVGRAFPVQDFTQFVTVDYPWGEVRVYVSKGGPRSRWGGKAHVLSNGLWQFDMRVPRDPGNPYGDAVAKDFYIDVSPKVKPEEPGYPFELNRQGFTEKAKQEFGGIVNFMSLVYRNADLQESAKNFGDIQHVTMGDDADPVDRALRTIQRVLGGDKVEVDNISRLTVSRKKKLEPTKKQETAVTLIQEGDVGEVVDGKLLVRGRHVPFLTPEQLENFQDDQQALLVDPATVDTRAITLHDNVDVQLSSIETRSLVDIAREKFGERFDTFVYQMGALFREMRDVLVSAEFPMSAEEAERIERVQGKKRNRARRWEQMRDEAIGVSFDIRYRGVSIRVPFSGSFLNIGTPEYVGSTPQAALSFIGTMIHELAHHNIRNEEHMQEAQRILVALDTHLTFNFQAYKQRVVDVVTAHEDVMMYLRGILIDGIFPIQPRGKRFEELGDQQTGDANPAPNVGAVRARTGALAGPSAGVGPGDPVARQEPRRADVSFSLAEHGADYYAERRAAAALLLSESIGDTTLPVPGGRRNPANGPQPAPRQPEVRGIVDGLRPLFQAVGGLPPQVQVAAAHADRFTKFHKWWHSLSQLTKANPNLPELINFYNRIILMHNDETQLQDGAFRISKEWQKLGGQQSEVVVRVLDHLANLRFLTPQERAQGVKRHPTGAELQRIFQQFGLRDPGVKVFNKIRLLLDGFLSLIESNAIQAAQRIITDPVRLAAKVQEIRGHIQEMRGRPYFPFLRFGQHFVLKTDSAGRTISFQTFERSGLRSAAAMQQRAYKAEVARALPGEKVSFGVLPEAAQTFSGMPQPMLDVIKTQLNLTPLQEAALEQIMLRTTPELSFKNIMKSNFVPGYSFDFRRAFARYFFHGARYYARTAHGHALRKHIKNLQEMPNDNKANLIGNHLQDYLDALLDAKGDHAYLKGPIFLWAMGFTVASATMNLTQIVASYTHLAAKFGGIGAGDQRAARYLIKAVTNVKNYYRRGSYKNQTRFDFRALSYGIETGRLTETQAAELASLSAGNSFLTGIGGNTLQRGWIRFMEASAFMFEMAEQFNRRTTFRAALDMAMRFPNSKAVQEAVRQYAAEFQALQAGTAVRAPFTPREAAAIVTAVSVVDQTQFIYARYDRPKFMLGRLPATVLVFKKYLHGMLTWMGQNPTDALPRYLLIMAMLGGLGGLPGYEDLKGLIKAFMRIFDKHVDVDREARKLVLNLFDGKLPPDLVLHGMSRVGFGIPALLDLLGPNSSRGLQTAISSFPDESQQGRGQNVPYPVLDRHRAMSLGNLAFVDPGEVLAPGSSLDRTIAQQAQKASGAVFSVGFNMYRALFDKEMEWTDFKRWERVMPRALSSASRAFRTYQQGYERGRGGPDSAPIVVPFDARDPEQMMEMIFMGMGYQPLRLQGKVDMEIAVRDETMYWDGRRRGLLAQYQEARHGEDPKEVEDMLERIRNFNDEVPEHARMMKITGETLRNSMQNRERQKQARERGVPVIRSHRPIAEHIQQLFPEGVVDVRPVR